MASIEFVAGGLEILGVAVIALAFVYATIRDVARMAMGRGGAYEHLKRYLGRALLLGLEFLVAADIIRTVTIESTLDGLLSLGLLVIVRIVLGWSISLELTGCWPWREAMNKGEPTARDHQPGAAKERIHGSVSG